MFPGGSVDNGESEKEKGHQISFVNLSVIQYLIQTNLTNNSKKSGFDKEILTALKEFAKLQGKESERYFEQVLDPVPEPERF